MYRENECLQLQLTKLVLLEKKSETDNDSLQQIINHNLQLKYLYRGFFPTDYVSTLDNDTFAITNMQPSNMHCERWIMISNSRQTIFCRLFWSKTKQFP